MLALSNSVVVIALRDLQIKPYAYILHIINVNTILDGSNQNQEKKQRIVSVSQGHDETMDEV